MNSSIAPSPPRTLLQRLLGEIPVETFLAQHYLRTPLAVPSRAADLIRLAGWETAEALLENPAADVLCAAAGKPGPATRPRSLAAARDLHDAGYTVAFRHVERHCPEFAELGRRLSAELQGALDLHLYFTPAGRTGFGWHYDPEEVFIFQLSGSKRYLMRENTLAPNPTLETMDVRADPSSERTPILEALLRPGDWVYLPGGIWHVASSVEDSVSLAVGLMPPTLLDVLDFVRRELAKDSRWRRRLPPVGHATALSDEARLRLSSQLLEEVAAGVSDSARLPGAAARLLGDITRAALRVQRC